MEEEVKDEEVKDEEIKEETVEAKPEAVESQEEEKAEETGEEKPLDKMTVPELKEIAKQIPGVTGASAMKKAELLSLVKEHMGNKDEEPDKKENNPPNTKAHARVYHGQLPCFNSAP